MLSMNSLHSCTVIIIHTGLFYTILKICAANIQASSLLLRIHKLKFI